MTLERSVKPKMGPSKSRSPFFNVSSCFPRKGVDVLLAAFVGRVQKRGDPVRLVIKGFPNPHNDVANQLMRLRNAPVASCPRSSSLMRTSKKMLCLISTAELMRSYCRRAEGDLNLPAAEAMAASIPLIVTGYELISIFAPPRTRASLTIDLNTRAATSPHPIRYGFEPSIDDLAVAMREVFEATARARRQYRRLASHARAISLAAAARQCRVVGASHR